MTLKLGRHVVRIVGKGLSNFCAFSNDYCEGFAEFKSGCEEPRSEGCFKKPTDAATLKLLQTKSFADNTEKRWFGQSPFIGNGGTEGVNNPSVLRKFCGLT